MGKKRKIDWLREQKAQKIRKSRFRRRFGIEAFGSEEDGLTVEERRRIMAHRAKKAMTEKFMRWRRKIVPIPANDL